MKIEKLEIRNFGKMQNRTLEFSDGIQLISGENESGKSTVHTFIRSMLFGMTRGRGRAAKNDVYSRYEPWENPAYYAGEMVLESGGKRFRLTRNFGRQNANAKLVCLTDGEVLSVVDGDLSMLLGGVSEIVYDNTASIGQLKGRTEEGLADELRNYMANYQGSSDGELDVAAALDLLKQKRKRLEQEQKKTLAGLEKWKEELETKISVFTEECRQSEENLQQAKEQIEAAQARAAKTPRRVIGTWRGPVFSSFPFRPGTMLVRGEVFKAIYSSLSPARAKQAKAMAR